MAVESNPIFFPRTNLVNLTTPQAKSAGHILFAERDPRCNRVLRAAERLYEEQPDWVSFFRTILGPEGIISREFPSLRELAQFEQTKAYTKIQQLLARLREREPAVADQQESTRVITVRLPESLHEALRVEAHQHRTSINKLCISKLLQFVEGELVPNEAYRRGRTQAIGRRKKPRAGVDEKGEIVGR